MVDPIRCRIPDILFSKGRTQSWLAYQTGLTRHRISDYVNMRRLMSIQIGKLIADELKVHIEDLYEWERVQPKE